jgi:aspartate aminotransferase-like enzyme
VACCAFVSQTKPHSLFFQVDEGASFSSFRIGLFGLDKIGSIDATLRNITNAVNKVNAFSIAFSHPSSLASPVIFNHGITHHSSC